MIDYKLITEKLEKALRLTSDALVRAGIQERVTGINDDIHAGEWTIAFEILCSNIHEYESPISKQAYELLKEIGLILKAERHYWEDLKPQIN